MNSCWDALQIEKTTDLGAIHRARRSLIKEWHPDAVISPAEKRAHTNRCVEINAAHDEAIRQAKTFNAVEPSPGQEQAAQSTAASTFRFTVSGTSIKQCFMAMALVLLFTFQSFIYLFVVLSVLTAVLLRIAAVAAVDFVIVKCIVKPVLSLGASPGLAQRRNQKAVTGLVLLLLNVSIVTIWPSRVGLTLFGSLVGSILRMSVACSIPVALFFLWFRENRRCAYE